MIKLNIDRSVLVNPKRGEVGGICRNNRGEVLFVVTSPILIASNNQVKTEAAIFGLTWCHQLGYTNVFIRGRLRMFGHLDQTVGPTSMFSKLEHFQIRDYH